MCKDDKRIVFYRHFSKIIHKEFNEKKKQNLVVGSPITLSVSYLIKIFSKNNKK